MREFITLVEALNKSFSDPKKPIYMWNDASNDGSLPTGFARLLDYSQHPLVASVGMVVSDGGVWEWHSADVSFGGQAATMEEAKRALEEALGLPVCPQATTHPPGGLPPKVTEALNTSLADPEKPIYLWGDSSNDKGLSKGFAWLLNFGNPHEDALACVQRCDEHGQSLGGTDPLAVVDGPSRWTVYPVLDPQPNEETGRPYFRSADHRISGQAPTFEEAKRAAESALGLPACGNHKPK